MRVGGEEKACSSFAAARETGREGDFQCHEERGDTTAVWRNFFGSPFSEKKM